MTLEVIGIGDLHLTDDKGHGGLSKYIEGHDEYVMSEVDRVCKYARKHHVSTIILYGDLCENPRMSYEAMLAFVACIRRNKDLNFITYLGNHDKLARDSDEGHSMQIIESHRLKNLLIFTKDSYTEIDGHKVKILPWPSTAFDPKVLNFAHTEVYGAKLDSGRKMEGDDLPKSKAAVAVGHLHTNHRIRNTYYSGTLYQTNFGESLPKFFHHIKFTSVDDFEIESVPFDPKYKLFNCVVETKADVEALPTDPHHLVKLVVKDGADIDIPARPNIVINKSFKSKQDLAAILTEDLMKGRELVLNSADFFSDWIAQQSVPERLKKRTSRLRERILGGQK